VKLVILLEQIVRLVMKIIIFMKILVLKNAQLDGMMMLIQEHVKNVQANVIIVLNTNKFGMNVENVLKILTVQVE